MSSESQYNGGKDINIPENAIITVIGYIDGVLEHKYGIDPTELKKLVNDGMRIKNIDYSIPK